MFEKIAEKIKLNLNGSVLSCVGLLLLLGACVPETTIVGTGSRSPVVLNPPDSIGSSSEIVAPVAQALSVSIAENQSVAVTLTATGESGSVIDYEVVVPPAHGALSGIAPALTYSSDTSYFGPDTFTYRAGDRGVWSRRCPQVS